MPVIGEKALKIYLSGPVVIGNFKKRAPVIKASANYIFWSEIGSRTDY